MLLVATSAHGADRARQHPLRHNTRSPKDQLPVRTPLSPPSTATTFRPATRVPESLVPVILLLLPLRSVLDNRGHPGVPNQPRFVLWPGRCRPLLAALRLHFHPAAARQSNQCSSGLGRRLLRLFLRCRLASRRRLAALLTNHELRRHHLQRRQTCRDRLFLPIAGRTHQLQQARHRQNALRRRRVPVLPGHLHECRQLPLAAPLLRLQRRLQRRRSRRSLRGRLSLVRIDALLQLLQRAQSRRLQLGRLRPKLIAQTPRLFRLRHHHRLHALLPLDVSSLRQRQLVREL